MVLSSPVQIIDIIVGCQNGYTQILGPKLYRYIVWLVVTGTLVKCMG